MSAILAADIVGFSSLMRHDDEATLLGVKEIFAVMRQLVEERHGRVFGGAGDSLLAEFPSPVQAVDCAIEIQRAGARRNMGQVAERLMQLRIGVNMGEVMAEGEGLAGSCVNLAARIEGLADPGGVAVSENVYRHIDGILPVAFEDMGERRMRGFPDPVRTFRAGPAVISQGQIAVAGFAESPPARREVSVKPVIVVLPLVNLSSDAQQEYFCHGLTTDLTAELSKFSSLSVVSSTTALAYKSGLASIQQASRNLDARYVLEGSVQKSASSVRVNIQLIDAVMDKHLWAKRLDRSAEDVLKLQDEIIESVVAVLVLKVEAEERERAMRKATQNLNAYDAFLRGSYLWLQHSGSDESKETMLEAREWLERATTLDPGYGRAWSWLSLTYIQEWLRSWGGRSALDRAGQLIKKAITIDAGDYNIHWNLAYYYLNARQYDLSLSEYEMARALNPNDANLLAEYAEALVYVGQRDEGLALTKQAVRMNPYQSDWYKVDIAWVNYLQKDYEAAVDEVNRLPMPNVDALLILAASQAQLADRRAAASEAQLASLAKQIAKSALKQALFRLPRWTSVKEERRCPFKSNEDLQHWLDGLRKAGLP